MDYSKYAEEELLEELTRRKKVNPYRFFKPNPKQQLFCDSNAKERWFLGGNKAGKTTIGIYEDIKFALGEAGKAVTKGWIVTETNELIREIAVPKLFEMLPKDSWHHKDWQERLNKLTLSNGSVIIFKSYEQGRKKFQSDSLDWIHLDEEPPEEIYTECKARLIDKEGRLWTTMTPLQGFTWAYHDVYLPWEDGEFEEDQLFLVIASLHDNVGFGITEKGLKAAEDLFKGKDLLIRLAGQWIDIGAQTLFDPESFHYYENEEAEDLNINFGYCDPAFKEKDTRTNTKKREPDDTCIITLKADPETGIAYVWEDVFFKKNPSVTSRTILDKYLHYRYKGFGMEENNAHAMRDLIREIKELDPKYKDNKAFDHFYIKPIPHMTDKVFRLNSNLVTPVVEGKIKFNKKKNAKLIKQLCIFPLKPPDDGPDALEGAWEMAKAGIPSGTSVRRTATKQGRRGARLFGGGRGTSSAVKSRKGQRLFR